MAQRGTGFFDRKGQYFKTPEEATVSDLAGILGKIGDGESLAPGIAYTILQRRGEIERLLAEMSKGKKLYGHLYDDILLLKYLHQRYTNYLSWLKWQSH